jgi:predicted ATPase
MRYLNVINEANQGLESALGSLSYVGPLREAFERFYQPLGHVPTDVGITGRRAPDIVIGRHDEPDFRAWLTRWLREFGFRGGFEVSPATTGVHRIDVRATAKGTPVNIADSGFGLSQVLPFIVHGVHAPTNSLLVAEQPEIHLNPRLHRKLADLFAAMIKLQRNILVETHSEHFVTRVRSLVAAGKLAPSDVSLLYVEKRGQQSTVREVNLLEDGSIPEGQWPAGFFDEAMREAVELLRARRSVRAK